MDGHQIEHSRATDLGLSTSWFIICMPGDEGIVARTTTLVGRPSVCFDSIRNLLLFSCPVIGLRDASVSSAPGLDRLRDPQSAEGGGSFPTHYYSLRLAETIDCTFTISCGAQKMAGGVQNWQCNSL